MERREFLSGAMAAVAATSATTLTATQATAGQNHGHSAKTRTASAISTELPSTTLLSPA